MDSLQKEYISNTYITESTIPDQLSGDTESTRNTEENSVVILFSETVVLEEDTRVGIHVGPRVLGLTVFSKNSRLKLKKKIMSRSVTLKLRVFILNPHA